MRLILRHLDLTRHLMTLARLLLNGVYFSEVGGECPERTPGFCQSELGHEAENRADILTAGSCVQCQISMRPERLIERLVQHINGERDHSALALAQSWPAPDLAGLLLDVLSEWTVELPQFREQRWRIIERGTHLDIAVTWRR